MKMKEAVSCIGSQVVFWDEDRNCYQEGILDSVMADSNSAAVNRSDGTHTIVDMPNMHQGTIAEVCIDQEDMDTDLVSLLMQIESDMDVDDLSTELREMGADLDLESVD